MQERKKPWHFLKSDGDTSASRSGQNARKILIAELIKTSALALSAFFTIVFCTAAWFVSNTKVDSGGIAISHQYETIKLATKGVRQEAETKLLALSGGETMQYNSETYYWTDEGEIALRLSDPEVAVSPGMTGKISFYIIPDRNGPQAVTLHLGLTGYEEINSGTGRKTDDIVLNSLLSGHILLFENYDNGQFSGWLPADNVSTEGANYRITATNPDAKIGEPWPVTIHWVWPLRYENMKADYNALLDDFIEGQTALHQIGETGYYYSQIFLTKNQDLTSAEARSDAYNQADEYIGKNAKYLYVTIQTNLVK